MAASRGVPETPRENTPVIDRPRCSVWGVLNVTPDSFSDGGRFLERGAAVAHARELLSEGADVIDVGGESTRPAGSVYGDGAAPVSADEETRRVVPVVRSIVEELSATVSIDTTKAEVADASIRAGARIVNDVSCGASDDLLEVAAKHGVELVLMHNRGRGEVSGANSRYADVVCDVKDELGAAAERAIRAGVSRDRVWIDPGLGFAKTAEQSMTLLASLPRLAELGFRMLVGPSRKFFLAAFAPKIDGSSPRPLEREGATVAAVTLAALGGAHAVRVHDVRLAHQAVNVVRAASKLGDPS